MSDRITLDESELAPAPPPPLAAPPGSGTGAPWPSGMPNPARIGDADRSPRDARVWWAVGGICGAMVLGGVSFVVGRESRPSPAEIRAQIERAVERDRVARTTPPKRAAAKPKRPTSPSPTTPKVPR